MWEEEANTGAASSARLIKNVTGTYLTPSAVSVLEDGSIVVGHAAYERRLTHPTLTATEFKRDIGSTREFKLGKFTFSAEQLSALVLSSLKADAEAELVKKIDAAVISVPAYFNDTQRKATLVAADLAELTVTRLVNEPTAAALSYGLAEDDGEPSNTLVFDLGGGTFDVSMVDIFEGIIEIKASTGDNYLGGEDFTTAIAKLLANKLAITDEASKDTETEARLRSVAERLKVELSRQPTAITSFTLGDQNLTVSVSEDEIAKACEQLLDKIRTPVSRAMRDSRIDIESLDSVVLVGGSTRMPLIRKLVARLLGRFPDTSVHPDQAIALGAATQAALVAQNIALKEVLLTDVCPYTLGVEVNSASVPGSTDDALFAPLIERNTIIPASRVEKFVTTRDYQRSVSCVVYQGEHRYVKDNIKIGSTKVKVPSNKAGMEILAVRFSYDVSGILDVDIEVESTGEKHSLTLLGNAASLDENEILRLRNQLSKLKIHPREDTANTAVIERADRLYMELSGEDRRLLAHTLDQFVRTLDSQDVPLIKQKRIEFSKWLDEAEKLLSL